MMDEGLSTYFRSSAMISNHCDGIRTLLSPCFTFIGTISIIKNCWVNLVIRDDTITIDFKTLEETISVSAAAIRAATLAPGVLS